MHLLKNMDLLFNTEMDIEVQYPEDSLFILKKCWLFKKAGKASRMQKNRHLCSPLVPIQIVPFVIGWLTFFLVPLPLLNP